MSTPKLPKVFGPKGCQSGDACEHKVFLEEYERVDRIYRDQIRRDTIEECARVCEAYAAPLSSDRSAGAYQCAKRIRAMAPQREGEKP